MQSLTNHRGVIIPFNRANMDTDVLLPKQYLKSLKSVGFGDFLLDDERYLDPGEVDTPIAERRRNPDCILNQPPYTEGTVVLAQANFGCGSSREHAVWALRDYGVRVLIAPSYGDIFLNNSFNNGILPIVLQQADVDILFSMLQGGARMEAHVDVAARSLTVGAVRFRFELEEGRLQSLLQGLDEIGQTLLQYERIKAYELNRRIREPWVFGRISPEKLN